MQYALWGSMLAFGLAGWLFHRHQNQQARIGGPISAAKSFWLFFVLYHYYALPLWLSFSLDPGIYGVALWVLMGLMLLRMLVQPVVMYVTKAWLPVYGMAFNAGTVALMGGAIFLSPAGPAASGERVTLAYLALVAALLLTDSYYAWAFARLVGRGTQGEAAVWYASGRSPSFARILRHTRHLNMIYFSYFVAWLTYILFHHDLLRP